MSELLRCGGCCTEKQTIEFTRDKGRATGFSFYCRECNREMRRARPPEEKKRSAERRKAYMLKYPEKLKLYNQRAAAKLRARRQAQKEKANG